MSTSGRRTQVEQRSVSALLNFVLEREVEQKRNGL
jgi:hypothetical protein